MIVQENVSLKQYNTFGIDALAKRLASFQSVAELEEVLERFGEEKKLVLGGGSNVLFTQNWDGLVLKNELPGIETIDEDAEYVYLKAGAGVNWHQLVLHTIAQNLGGMENLSLIPGCTGASPMQNIGAYGVEIKDIFHSLEAYDMDDKTIVTFGLADCQFGYRESVFKHRYKGRFIILNVTFQLRKQPVFNIEYGAIRQELERMQVQALSVQAISQAVINIRRSKLPDPNIIGNAGSFFKNPEISSETFTSLKQQFPDLVAYVLDNGNYKLAAGWLIEQCGWKGYRQGDAGCHAQQALVLVNYGTATGHQIFELSQQIMDSVQSRFGVLLEREVNII
jgi:UDP-N-acetylmuramate dehydrogenase